MVVAVMAYQDVYGGLVDEMALVAMVAVACQVVCAGPLDASVLSVIAFRGVRAGRVGEEAEVALEGILWQGV